MSGVAGKVVIVTGGSRGIGAATAAALARDGAKVMVAARDGARAASVAQDIAAANGTAAAMPCDMSDYAAVEALVRETEHQFGPVEVLVNNAGIIEPIGPLAETEPEAWAQSIQTNLTGAYHGVRAVLPGMLTAGRGTIINVSSGAAHRPLEGWSAYSAGKAGLAMLTRSILLETGAAGIRVFGLSPGTIDTDMQVSIRASGVNPVSQIPRANLAPAEHPALAIAYLSTAAADDLSGQEVSLGDPEFRRRVGLR